MGVAKRICFLLVVSSLIFFTFCQDHPAYSEDNLPHTRFSCKNKVHGGYYADIETGCQMYHVCARNKDGNMRSTKFLCGNGTVFDQRHLVCQDYRKVHRCEESRKYYNNVATLLERLEARLRSEEKDKEILEADPPAYSGGDMPQTRFSCQNKVHGGFYADIETGCQMYHVCARNKDGNMRSIKFLCGNGTVFDQRLLVCQDYYKVHQCQQSRRYYNRAATRKEILEARRRTQENDKAISKVENFEVERLK